MTRRLLPHVGQWYKDLDRDDLFQVVAVDDRSSSVEIQDFEGNIDEFDLEDWHQRQLEEAEAPEDWTGPVDDIEADDLGYTDTGVMEGPALLPEDGAGAWRDQLAPDGDASAEEPPRHRPTLRPLHRFRRPGRH